MALKGGRRIVVRDRVFFWKVSGLGCRHASNSDKAPHVAIQEATDRPGLPMVAYLESKCNLFEVAHNHKAIITPRDIRVLIEHALDAGWAPTAKGATYRSPAGIELREYKTVE